MDPLSLIDEFRRTVQAVRGLNPDVDAALVAAGETICRQVDATLSGEEVTATEKTKALYLLPHLVNILREMEATPKARTEAAPAEQQSGGVAGGTASRRRRAAQRRAQAGSA